MRENLPNKFKINRTHASSLADVIHILERLGYKNLDETDTIGFANSDSCLVVRDNTIIIVDNSKISYYDYPEVTLKDLTEYLNKVNDPINPSHYKTNSIECIEIAELFPYTLGNAIKYAWRAGLKDNLIQDLNKCLWYVNRAIGNGDDFVDEKVFGLARRKFNQINSKDFKRYKRHYDILHCLIQTNVEQAREYLIQTIQHLQVEE